MKKPNAPGEISERDVTTAVKSLSSSAAFKSRFVRTDCNVKDPKWKAPNGRPIIKYVGDKMDQFKKDVGGRLFDLDGGVLYAVKSDVLLMIVKHGLLKPYVPTPADLFHVYGPDKDQTKDWRSFYRFAWKDKGPNGIFYSTDTDIIKDGKLSCSSYAYSGQSSWAIVGAGIFFKPEYGNAKIIIRPYVQWQTAASFTGTEHTPASAAAFLGIWVESWKLDGSAYMAEFDKFIPVWSWNTTSFLTNLTAGGAASGGDDLTLEMTTVTERKYAIYVYAYLETTAAPAQGKNELRFVRIDIDAVAPYVVVEEKLL